MKKILSYFAIAACAVSYANADQVAVSEAAAEPTDEAVVEACDNACTPFNGFAFKFGISAGRSNSRLTGTEYWDGERDSNLADAGNNNAIVNGGAALIENAFKAAHTEWTTKTINNVDANDAYETTTFTLSRDYSKKAHKNTVAGNIGFTYGKRFDNDLYAGLGIEASLGSSSKQKAKVYWDANTSYEVTLKNGGFGATVAANFGKVINNNHLVYVIAGGTTDRWKVNGPDGTKFGKKNTFSPLVGLGYAWAHSNGMTVGIEGTYKFCGKKIKAAGVLKENMEVTVPILNAAQNAAVMTDIGDGLSIADNYELADGSKFKTKGSYGVKLYVTVPFKN